MNYLSLALAALGGTVACFAVGGLMFVLAPGLIKESHNSRASIGQKKK